MGLLSELGIAGQNADELGPQPGQRHEYNGHSLTSLFAQRRNLLKPAFWGLLSEIVRFNRLAKLALTEALDPCATLESFLTRHRFSPLRPPLYSADGAAIWSSSLQEMRRFPLPLFCASLKTTVCWIFAIARNGTWCPAVPGNTSAPCSPLGDRLDLRLNAPVQQVDRHPAGSPCGWRPGRRILTSDLRLPLRAGPGDAGGAHRFRTRSPWGHRLAA